VVNETPLRTWRRSKGVSIRELEKRTGINRGRLSQVERGIPATSDELAKIAKALEHDDE